MSSNLSSVAVEQFDSEVKHAYQGVQTLRGCIKVRNNVTGDKYDFRVMGKGAATVRTGSSADVVPMGTSHALKVATLVDYEAPEYTDVFDAATVNFDEIVELATTIAGAMGRRDDQSIIDAMAASTNTFVDATPGLDTLINASKTLNSKDVPAEDRYFICDENFLAALLGDTTLTSADYATVRALQAGTINSFMGFEFKIIPSARAEGGLGGNAYAIHKSSIGHAVGIDMNTRVDYVPHKASYLSIGMWKAGSVLIDTDGVVKITAA